MIKNIIFDFDGVILDSVNIKTEAFREMYIKYDESSLDKIIEYHLQQGGLSRYKKIKYFEEQILKKKISTHDINMLAKIFEEKVKSKVINCKYIDGALEFIMQKSELYDLYISTGTPQKEIEEIVNAKLLNQYFKKIYGSPNSKMEHIQNILINSNSSKKNTIFIGDSESDYESASQMGLKFLGVGKKDYFLNNGINFVNDLTQLENYLSQLK
tara:strand:+ start:234 stop:872 length:639 start_codon:yes stop_codon:yes gene_type:complete